MAAARGAVLARKLHLRGPTLLTFPTLGDMAPCGNVILRTRRNEMFFPERMTYSWPLEVYISR